MRHELNGLQRINRVQKRRHHITQLLELHRLRQIGIKTGINAFCIHIPQDVCRQGDHGDVFIAVLFLPGPDIFARLISVFVGHVKITLSFVNQDVKILIGSAYENDRVVPRRLGEDLISA